MKCTASHLFALFLMGFLTLGRAHAAPAAELWERWDAHDASSNETIEHSAWDGFLAKYVRTHPDGINRVDYANVAAGDKAVLENYLEVLQATPVSRFNRNEQRAFWINLYNALTVHVVLEHYPVVSIRDIRSGLFSSGPWGLDLARVEGEALTLDDIEHRILRPVWRDPRLHYAVNCASLGCPNLLPTAFTAQNTEQQLDFAASAFINHPRGAAVVDGRLQVSSIFDWFVEDFGGDDAGVIAHLRQHADPALSESLANITSVSDDDYDWQLNDLTTAIE